MKNIVSREWKTQYTEEGIGLVNFVATAEICKFDNQSPYFALTCWYKAKNTRSGYEGGGADHESIVKLFPALAPYVKWHLCGTDGPMHYLANSLYWAGFSGWCNGKPDDPPNLEYLKSTCVYGALPEDYNFDIANADREQLEQWLRNRHDRLIDQFLAEMQELFPELEIKDREVES